MKHWVFLTFTLLLLGALPTAQAETETQLEMYATEEMKAILDFMQLQDVEGKSNEQKWLAIHPHLKPFSPQKPWEWHGITWKKEDDFLRVQNLNWSDADFDGTLDLRQFSALEELWIFTDPWEWETILPRKKGNLRVLLPEKSCLKRFICCGMGISELNLENQRVLENLQCMENPLKKLDLTQTPNLRHLACENCPIQVKFAPQNQIEVLSISGDSWTFEQIYALKNLKSIRWKTTKTLPENFIKHVSKCEGLSFRKISNSNLDFSQNRELYTLDLEDLPHLETLDLRNSTKMSHLSLKNCPKLRKILLPHVFRPTRENYYDLPCFSFRDIAPEVIEFSDGTSVSYEEFQKLQLEASPEEGDGFN